MLIYVITNTVNGKKYVGITRRTSLSPRWHAHRYSARHDLPGCTALKRAMQKYGEVAFTIEKVGRCDDEQNLTICERLFIKRFNSKPPHGYNLSDGGEQSACGVKRSPEHREALRKAVLARHVELGHKIGETERGLLKAEWLKELKKESGMPYWELTSEELAWHKKDQKEYIAQKLEEAELEKEETGFYPWEIVDELV